MSQRQELLKLLRCVTDIECELNTLVGYVTALQLVIKQQIINTPYSTQGEPQAIVSTAISPAQESEVAE